MKKRRLNNKLLAISVLVITLISGLIYLCYFLLKHRRDSKLYTEVKQGFFENSNVINNVTIDSIVVDDFFLDKYVSRPDPSIKIYTTVFDFKDQDKPLLVINELDTMKFFHREIIKIDNNEFLIRWYNSKWKDTHKLLTCDIDMLGGKKVVQFFGNSTIILNDQKILGTNETIFRFNLLSGIYMIIDENLGFHLIYGIFYDKKECLVVLEIDE
ncbi:hypothetical protein EI427_21615 [Flammeovirga pectinis]|uniref:Uncharacterized protein n=1 Tax=Flammeovirga pectinis TaxID=2494373 RepID=A0A3Q9FSD1_9BACT|nr:hypothetical protein [Flammeovirga pectinis]AZQ64826.1 hypothetical protein EI427_21615 [Flammeovirga pectinis]